MTLLKINVDGKLYKSPTVTFDYYFSQRRILVISNNCIMKKNQGCAQKVAFNNKEQADGFKGKCFSHG